jgi:nicotinamide phosphoribosyltransferase
MHKFDFITLADGYKLDHRRQYPNKTQNVYSNWTARNSRIQGVDSVVFFILQYVLQAYFIELANETFFDAHKQTVLEKYQKRLNGYFGPNSIGVDHIAALHDLGYVPLEFRAVPEGTRVPLRVPMFTIESTHSDFAWVTNYFESMLSNLIWKGCTSATHAHRMRAMFDRFARVTGDPAFVDWQGHDFSFRGMSGIEDAAMSGAGHLLSFTGTDTLPALELLEKYYYGGNEPLLGMSVPATEHSVMCAGGETDEEETYSRLLSLYPQGIVSIVSDTWDLWHVIGHILPRLKDQILARDGKTVIRPDSGDPVDILCGDHRYTRPDLNELPLRDSLIQKGVVEALWDIFGGTVNEKGFKVLDSHIGAIYGDSITYERAQEIFQRLEAKGFASTNVVLGLGSYFYEYNTRDTYGFAMKATAAVVGGKEHMLFKDPKTDSGVKKSAKGRIVVLGDGNIEPFHAKDQLDKAGQAALSKHDNLAVVWRNGMFHKKWTVGEVRANIRR